ncbi:MAG: hypothetical protein QOF74_2443 [Caballeronia mineralivorans]|jgi:hypothetical protein|nr:hypothetical protein [Caballeronia mineralivorans]
MAFGQAAGGMAMSDEVVKGSITSYVFENLEIASYTSLIAANWLLVSLLWGSQDASDIREPAKQDGSLRKMAAIGLSKRII